MNYFIGAETPIAVANRHLAHGVFTYKGVVCPFAQKDCFECLSPKIT